MEGGGDENGNGNGFDHVKNPDKAQRPTSKRSFGRLELGSMAKQMSQDLSRGDGCEQDGQGTAEDKGGGAGTSGSSRRTNSSRGLGGSARRLDLNSETVESERPSTVSGSSALGREQVKPSLTDKKRTASFKALTSKTATSRVAEPLPSPSESGASPPNSTIDGPNDNYTSRGEHWAPLVALEAVCLHLSTRGRKVAKELRQEKYLAPIGSSTADTLAKPGSSFNNNTFVVDLVHGNGVSVSVHEFISKLATMEPALVDKFHSLVNYRGPSQSDAENEKPGLVLLDPSAYQDDETLVTALLEQEIGPLMEEAPVDLLLEALESLCLGVPLVPPAARRELIETFESAEVSAMVARGVDAESYKVLAPILHEKLPRVNRHCLRRLCVVFREATSTGSSSNSREDAGTREIAADWLSRVLLLGQPRSAIVKSFRAASASKAAMAILLEHYGTGALASPAANAQGSGGGAHGAKKRHRFRRMLHTIKHKIKGEKDQPLVQERTNLEPGSDTPVVLSSADGDITFLSKEQYSTLLSSKAKTFGEVISVHGRPPPPPPPLSSRMRGFVTRSSSGSFSGPRTSSGSIDANVVDSVSADPGRQEDKALGSAGPEPSTVQQSARKGRRRRSLSLTDAEAIKRGCALDHDEDDLDLL